MLASIDWASVQAARTLRSAPRRSRASAVAGPAQGTLVKAARIPQGARADGHQTDSPGKPSPMFVLANPRRNMLRGHGKMTVLEAAIKSFRKGFSGH